MRGHVCERIRHGALPLATGLLLAMLPGAAVSAEPIDTAGLPDCAAAEGGDRGGAERPPWQVMLDDDGVVSGHQLRLRDGNRDVTVRTGRRGFAVPVGPDRVLVGERDDDGTTMAMLDTAASCRVWTRRLTRLAYPEREATVGSSLRLTLVEPGSRAFAGTRLLDPETGDSTGLIDGECMGPCVPNDGDISVAAFATASAPQPVPSFAAGGWARGKTLPFRWKPGAVPPAWAKAPLLSAADDALRTSFARSPKFVLRADATNAVAYTGSPPGYCGPSSIACAGRSMPTTTWGVWLRPHGTEYAWGTLRWCQRNARAGCLDIRRVMLHELGHIGGLNHPSTAGFTLSPSASIMGAVTPSRPKAGSSRHAFGACDVATLQELYDTPNNRTLISTCNDVATRISLSPSRSTVAAGGSVKFTARLRVVDRSTYRQLAGNPLNGRSVKLKYRRAGSDASWKTLWMKPTYSQGRYELSIVPAASWEFKAVFPAPSDEGLRYSRTPIVKVKVRTP